MKVRATKVGFYGGFRRRVGEEFVLSNAKQFSAKWMEKVTGPAPVKVASVKEPETFSEMNLLNESQIKKVREGK